MELLHITVNTGHARLSPRSEVGDEAIGLLIPLIERALSGQRVQIPAPEPCYLEARPKGRNLLAVLRDAANRPVITMAVGVENAEAIWRDLSGVPIAPPVPWCAVRLEAAVVFHLPMMRWIGDLERCLAWAWIVCATS